VCMTQDNNHHEINCILVCWNTLLESGKGISFCCCFDTPPFVL